ncbi:MAG: hypothetical protein QXV17_09220 [Candidatus Micrarchaeaceae archaeon]
MMPDDGRIDDLVLQVRDLSAKVDKIITDHERRISSLETIAKQSESNKTLSLRKMAVMATLTSAVIATILSAVLIHFLG